MDPQTGKPRFGIGTLVQHAFKGPARVLGYEGHTYRMLFKGGEVTTVDFAFEGLSAAGEAGDPELDRLKLAVAEVLGDHGWLDCGLELAPKWTGGTLRLIPGKEGLQPKDLPVEAFFKKVIGVREKLRVLEQKINNHPTLSSEEKLELEGYITRCYGSLTSFNVLFAHAESHFKGQGSGE